MSGLRRISDGGAMSGSMGTNKGVWTIGLHNSRLKYLTAESFGFRTNANAGAMKKKQVWTLEPYGDGDSVCLKSHLGVYMAVDQYGNVTCENEEKDESTKFEISVCDDFSGRWAFKSIARGQFLGASSENLICRAKAPSDPELWYVHLAARPQVNLRSIGRKRFAHLSDDQDEIWVNSNVPWGEDTLFTLEFREESKKYAIHTCNDKYLMRDGKLVPQINKDCMYALEYHGGNIALRDFQGMYLSPIGSRAVMKTRSNMVTKDELFSLEDCLPQASFIAAFNSRYISTKQGVDLTANQEEISDHEKFQLEHEKVSDCWYIRTMQDKYFTMQPGGGVQASESIKTPNGMFDLLWQEDGTICLRAKNGKLIGIKKSGHLFANCEEIEEKTKFYFYLINRPILVLKCDQGFVGYKSAGSTTLASNKASYEIIRIEKPPETEDGRPQVGHGLVYLKGNNQKYWHVSNDGISCDADSPEGFYLELREPTKLCIKTSDGQYINCEKNGAFKVGSSDQESATRWEF